MHATCGRRRGTNKCCPAPNLPALLVWSGASTSEGHTKIGGTHVDGGTGQVETYHGLARGNAASIPGCWRPGRQGECSLGQRPRLFAWAAALSWPAPVGCRGTQGMGRSRGGRHGSWLDRGTRTEAGSSQRLRACVMRPARLLCSAGPGVNFAAAASMLARDHDQPAQSVVRAVSPRLLAGFRGMAWPGWIGGDGLRLDQVNGSQHACHEVDGAVVISESESQFCGCRHAALGLARPGWLRGSTTEPDRVDGCRRA
jgi:hypothetical protein